MAKLFVTRFKFSSTEEQTFHRAEDIHSNFCVMLTDVGEEFNDKVTISHVKYP